METKEKLISIEFIRVFCAIGIILHHFSTDVSAEFKPFLSFANGSWGDVIVTVFFVISGGMLYLNNNEIPSLKKFYYKRFKSIFPMFYIVFLLLF